MSEPQSITLAFPRDAEAVRQAILKELDSMGIAVKSLYGRVQEHKGHQPTGEDRTLQMLMTRANILVLRAAITSIAPILDSYFATKAAHAIRIDTGQSQVIELRGTADIEGAVQILRKLQCTPQDPDSDPAISTSPSP